MTHSFLLEAGYWTLTGNWLERDKPAIPVKGKTLIAWGQDDWFSMVTKLVFPQQEHDEIAFQYRGHMDESMQRYTFVLMHSVLGRVEGEGWLGPDTIIQRYWVLGDRQRRSGFETLYRVNNDLYQLSSAIMAGHYLTSAMEAMLARANQ
ncbi:MAG: hypothetical protein AAGF24_00800 [Cyanobacteria bacterium P01_H01_bin.121]